MHIAIGGHYTFHTTDSDYLKYNGEQILIARALTDRECDIPDVGNMYKGFFEDGNCTDVFEDELSEPNGVGFSIEKLTSSKSDKYKHMSEEVFASAAELEPELKNAAEIIQMLSNMLVSESKEWVSVKDHLPTEEQYQKNEGKFLLYDGIRQYVGYYDFYGKSFVFPRRIGKRKFKFCDDQNAVKWRPLPEICC